MDPSLQSNPRQPRRVRVTGSGVYVVGLQSKEDRWKDAVRRFHAYFDNPTTRPELRSHQPPVVTAVGHFLNSSLEDVTAGRVASGAIIMPTGTGKTVLAAEITAAIGFRTIILAPTLQIAYAHFQESLNRLPPHLKPSLYCGESKDLSGQVLVTTYQSAVSLFKSGRLPKVDVAIYDEAHGSISPERKKLHGVIAPLEIGLTATPEFNESRHIWTSFDRRIYELSLMEALELRAICPLEWHIVDTNVDVSHVELRMGSGDILDERKAERYLNVVARNRAAVDFYKEHLFRLPTLACCVSISHCEGFAEMLNDEGIRAAAIHSKVPNKVRKDRLAAFDAGEVDVVTSRDVLLVGWDSPRLRAILCLRPTFSRVVATHMVGRVLRLDEGKEVGVAVNFRDHYRTGDRPILAPEVFSGSIRSRKAGVIRNASSLPIEEEDKMDGPEPIDSGALPSTCTALVRYEKPVGKEPEFPVGYTTEQGTFRDESVDLTQTEMLKQVLLSTNLDFSKVSFSEFMGLKFDHPKFSGSGLNLLFLALGAHVSGEFKPLKVSDYHQFLCSVFGPDFKPTEEQVHIFEVRQAVPTQGIYSEPVFTEPSETVQENSRFGRYATVARDWLSLPIIALDVISESGVLGRFGSNILKKAADFGHRFLD